MTGFPDGDGEGNGSSAARRDTAPFSRIILVLWECGEHQGPQLGCTVGQGTFYVENLTVNPGPFKLEYTDGCHSRKERGKGVFTVRNSPRSPIHDFT